MKGLKKQRRIQVIVVAAVSLAASTALIGYGMREGINLYVTPSHIVEYSPLPSEVIKIGGLVEEGTLLRGQGESITFNITDGGASIKTSFTGVLPDLFSEGQSTVATGSYIGGVFIATEILAKHDENYMPKEVRDSLEEQGVLLDSVSHPNDG